VALAVLCVVIHIMARSRLGRGRRVEPVRHGILESLASVLWGRV